MLLDEDAELADTIVAVDANELKTQTNGHRVKRPWPKSVSPVVPAVAASCTDTRRAKLGSSQHRGRMP